MKAIIIRTELHNTYGIVEFVKNNDDTYEMTLADHDCMNSIVITKEFFEAAKNSFGINNKKEMVSIYS